ncbi:MAG: hypothetical protein ACXVH7_02320, partial [Thermoanaerobaculia bacterium]
MLSTVTVVGVVVLAVLVWLLVRTRSKDHIAELMARRVAASKIVSRADYVEGMARMPVALSLADDALHYENADLQASFELKNIEEIEYDDELATGKSIEHGFRALRLRSHGATFEFILDPIDCQKW